MWVAPRSEAQSSIWCIVNQPISGPLRSRVGYPIIHIVQEISSAFAFFAILGAYFKGNKTPLHGSLHQSMRPKGKLRFVVQIETFPFLVSRNFAQWIDNMLNSCRQHNFTWITKGDKIPKRTLQAHPVRAFKTVLCWDSLPSDRIHVWFFQCDSSVDPLKRFRIFGLHHY
jgi:hypothetical protein